MLGKKIMNLNKLFRKVILILMLVGAASFSVETQLPTAYASVKKSQKKAKTNKKARRVKKTSKKKHKKITKIRLDKKKHKTKKASVKIVTNIPVTTAYVGISDPILYQDTLDAINAWNQTKAVAIVPVKKPSQAYIQITSGNYGNTGWGGETLTNLGGAHTPSKVYINTYITSRLAKRERLVIIEHELGHALGLNHIDDRPSVMNSVLNIGDGTTGGYLIQPDDILFLKALYREK